jgi:hypothetical protein
MVKRKNEDKNTVERCAICLEDKKIEELVILNNCCHKYCPECIDEWKKSSNECPQCKKRFTSLDIPGKKKNKRVKRANFKADDHLGIGDHEFEHNLEDLISVYLRDFHFRQTFASCVLQYDPRVLGVFRIIRRIINGIASTIMAEMTVPLSSFERDVLSANKSLMRLSRDLNGSRNRPINVGV